MSIFLKQTVVLPLIPLRLSSVGFHGTASAVEGICARVPCDFSDTEQSQYCYRCHEYKLCA